MKVLFVASGNTAVLGLAPFIISQAESLVKAGVEVRIFTVKGRGFRGYLRAAREISKELKKYPADVIHAHYVLCGWAALLAFSAKPLVLSLLGTDTYGRYVAVGKVSAASRLLRLLTWVIQPFVRMIIVKTEQMRRSVFRRRICRVIANGVDLDKFKHAEKEYRDELGLAGGKKYLLFLGDPGNRRKNLVLAEEALALLQRPEVELLKPYPLAHEQVPCYLNAVDVLLQPSLMEGSPNLVKEAMACNCPVVATDVGDVRWLFGDLPGYYLAGFKPNDFMLKIRQALDFAATTGRTQGRRRIVDLGLDAPAVAAKIIDVYREATRFE